MIIWIKKESNAQNYDFIQEIDANKSQVSFPFFSYFLNFPAKKIPPVRFGGFAFFLGREDVSSPVPLCTRFAVGNLCKFFNRKSLEIVNYL